VRYSKRRLDSSANERCREEVIADQVRRYWFRSTFRIEKNCGPELQEYIAWLPRLPTGVRARWRVCRKAGACLVYGGIVISRK
jgi:hypothetical protein